MPKNINIFAKLRFLTYFLAGEKLVDHVESGKREKLTLQVIFKKLTLQVIPEWTKGSE